MSDAIEIVEDGGSSGGGAIPSGTYVENPMIEDLDGGGFDMGNVGIIEAHAPASFVAVKGIAAGASSLGVLGDATGTGAGVQGNSIGGISGIFQSMAEANAAPTLVVKRFSAPAAANLLEVQDQTGAPLGYVTSGGELEMDTAVATGAAIIGFNTGAGSGVYGNSTAGRGIEGNSSTGPCGFFQPNIAGNTSPIILAKQHTLADTGPGIQVQNPSAGVLFGVSSIGDITKIRGVTTTFPAANAAGALTNNGSGTFSYVAASGGITAQEQIDMAWQKKFFSDASLLPATERVAASLAVFPTEGGTNGTNTPLFTKDTGVARLSGTAGADVSTYWDLGALRSTVLVVIGGMQLGGGTQGALMLSATLPNAVYMDGYAFWQEPANGFRIQKRASGSWSALGTAAVNLTSAAQTVVGMALYYDDATGVLKAFVRYASGGWFLAVSTTDSTYTTMRYVTLHIGALNTVGRMILPFTAWSE